MNIYIYIVKKTEETSVVSHPWQAVAMASIFTSTGKCSSWAATFVAPWWTLPGAKDMRFKCVTGCICLTEMAASTLFSLLQVMDEPAHMSGL